MNVAERIAQNKANSAISVVAGFSKSQPTGFDTDGVLDKDDVIHFPKDMPEVNKQVFGMRRDENGNPVENYAEFIVVEVTNSKNETRAINFFPSSLTKNVWPAVKGTDGAVTTVTANGPYNPTGSAVDEYRKYQGKGTKDKTDMQLGMEALLGHDVKVTNRTPIDVQRWRNGAPVNEIRTTGLFEYELL